MSDDSDESAYNTGDEIDNESYDGGSDTSDLESDTDDSTDSEIDIPDARVWNTVRPATPPRFPFQSSPGLQVHFDNTTDILTFFEHFINDEIISMICTETNRYARESESFIVIIITI